MAFFKAGETVAPFSEEKTAEIPAVELPVTPEAKPKENPPPSFVVWRVMLFVFALVSVADGVRILNLAKSAMHEIEGYLLLLTGAVFFCTAVLLDAARAILKYRR